MSTLPFELVHKILRQLPLNQAFQARRVSEYWREILSAPETTGSFLGPWFQGWKTSLCTPDALSTTEIDSLKAEHVHACCNEIPCSSTWRTWVLLKRDMNPKEVAYAERMIAHVSSWSRVTAVNLRTGFLKILVGDGSATKQSAVSSSMIVAVTANGKYYVRNLISAPEYKLTLLTIKVHSLVVSATSLATLYDLPLSDPTVNVATWSLKGRKQAHFFIDSNLSPIQNPSISGVPSSGFKSCSMTSQSLS